VKPCLLDDLILIKVEDNSSPFSKHLKGKHLDSKKHHFANRVKKQLPGLADNSVYHQDPPVVPKTADYLLQESMLAVGTFNGTFVTAHSNRSRGKRSVVNVGAW